MASKEIFQDKEAEEALLGCFLIDNNILDLALSYLKKEDFYFKKNQFLFEQMLKVYKKQGAFDYVILYPLVKQQISSQELLDLMEKPSTVQMANAYLKRIKILSCERQIQNLVLKLQGQSQSIDNVQLTEKIGLLKTELNKIENELNLEEEFNFQKDLTETLEITEELTKKESLAFPTNIHIFDKHFGGFHRQRIYILGARPGHGKTSFLAWFTANISKYGYKVLYISPEMAKKDLILRMLCSQSNIENRILENPKLLTEENWKVITNTAAKMYDYKIAIYDKKCSIQHVNFLAQKIKPDILIIDYIQHMQFKSMEFRAIEINNIMNELKNIAKENNCSVIIASQISRQIEERQSKLPMSSDYKSSGSIEEGGDMAMFLLWPYKFNLRNNPKTHSPWQEEDKHIITIVISKNRFGPTGDFELRFNYENYSFENLQLLKGGS